jgi:hypothetical protein
MGSCDKVSLFALKYNLSLYWRIVNFYKNMNWWEDIGFDLIPDCYKLIELAEVKFGKRFLKT